MCRSPHSLLTQPANCRQRRWVPDGGAGATAVSLRAPQPPSLSSRAAKRDTSGGGASPPELARPRSRGGPTNVTVGFAAWGGRSRAGCGSLLVMIKEEQWQSEEET
jgi:hypothetical protein